MTEIDLRLLTTTQITGLTSDIAMDSNLMSWNLAQTLHANNGHSPNEGIWGLNWSTQTLRQKETYRTIALAVLKRLLTMNDKMVEAAARAVSDSFHEEGFSEGDDPALWEEYRKAGRRAFEEAIKEAMK